MPARAVRAFFFWLVVVYGLLAAPWPGLREGYAAAYRSVANRVFGTFGENGRVRFERPPPGAPMDSVLAVRNRTSAVVGRTPHSGRLTGYLPTAEVIALILATPIPWARRWRALGLGFLLVQLFVAARIAVTLLFFFAGDQPWCLYRPGPFWGAVLRGTFELGVVSPVLTFVFPLFIWVAVTFRAGDWEAIVAREGGSGP